ncbi:hypothetical protein NBH20_00120 [Rhizobium sp. S153]|uniref:Uncharacterized protein n=1 Tax=Ciceribacter sichuanensis TaxID=2949647 RepID=A0ABT0V0X5_9HYPH|nr:hypothetical protein [Ciceribacter sp. S153]MCM2399549.1 hypothetical protein [Ciceribacter sp. S153]
MEKVRAASAVAGVIAAIAAVASVVIDYTAIFSNDNNTASEYRISTGGADSPVVVGAGGNVNIGSK